MMLAMKNSLTGGDGAHGPVPTISGAPTPSIWQTATPQAITIPGTNMGTVTKAWLRSAGGVLYPCTGVSASAGSVACTTPSVPIATYDVWVQTSGKRTAKRAATFDSWDPLAQWPSCIWAEPLAAHVTKDGANPDLVSAWTDMAGNAFATNGNATYPIWWDGNAQNGRPAMRAHLIVQYMAINVAVGATATIAIVTTKHTVAAGGYLIGTGGGNTAFLSRSLGDFSFLNSPSHDQMVADGAASAGAHVLSLTFDADKLGTTYYDGAQASQRTYSHALYTPLTALFNYNAGSTNASVSWLSSFLVAPLATAPQLALLHRFLKTRFATP
jgi:hypothetical protein